MCTHLFREADQVIIRQTRGFPTIVSPARAGANNPCTINRMIEIEAMTARVSSGGGYGPRLAPG
jgi:hypothetical protein